MIKYVLHQRQKDGTLWVSAEDFEAQDIADVKRAVRAGFLHGEPRWAETPEGEPLFGLLGDGSEMSP